MRMRAAWLAAVCVLGPCASPAAGQTRVFSGFAEAVATLYPQAAANDDVRAVAAGLARLDPAITWTRWRLDASFEARADSHDMTAATAAFRDRTIRRPALTARRLSATWSGDRVSVEIGKQFIRWGKTDIVVPTERFAPRDYLEVVQSELLAVTAARVTFTRKDDSLDLVVTPQMTPSRTPLLDQRWIAVPGAPQGLTLADAGAEYPDGVQFGARWNHLGQGLEYSVSAFRGFNHLPEFVPTAVPGTLAVEVERRYPQLTSVGGDVAIPMPAVTVKAEAAWLTSSTAGTEDYLLYVLQLERQAGEWLFIGGYAGEIVTDEGTAIPFAPDRGLAKAFVGRASYTIDTNRSILFEAVARQNGDGFLGRFEYSQAMGAHTRVTAGFRLIRGSEDDFLGRYRRNSSASVAWRYSF